MATDKLARPATLVLERMARSPLTAWMPDILAATVSIGASSGTDPMGLLVAMMSGFAAVYAPTSARRVEDALMAFARELDRMRADGVDRPDLRDEEFLHLLRDLIVHAGRHADERERARVRHMLIEGLREQSPRTRLWFDLATRLTQQDVDHLTLLSVPHANALATPLDLAVLEREGLVANGAITELGAQFLRLDQRACTSST